MAAVQAQDGEWEVVCKKGKKGKEPTVSITRSWTSSPPHNPDFQKVSSGLDNEIWQAIQEQLSPHSKVGCRFRVFPLTDKYQIEVLETKRGITLLSQSHLHTDTRDGRLIIGATRYVRVNW